MKKILSIAVALVLLIGLIPVAGMMNTAAADTASLAITATGGTLSGDSLSISWSGANFTLLNEKAGSNTAIRTSDSNHFRVYASNKTTITAASGKNLSQIVVTVTESKYASPLVTSVSNAGFTAVADGTTVTITVSGVNSISFTASAQWRLNQIEVTTVAGGDTDISDNTSTSSSTSTTTTTTTTTTTQAPTDGAIVFDLGANGTAAHVDGSAISGAKEFASTDGAYTLTITPTAKAYEGSFDAMGNSCIKLGTSSAAGGFTLTAPEGVTSVVFYVGGYKANAAKIEVNGTAHTINTMSNNGEYTKVVVDTTTEKAITFTTVSGGYRCMINTIEFLTGGATVATTTTTAATIYETPAEIMAAAYALGQGEVLSNSHVYTLSGVITNVDTIYNSDYSNVTVTMLVDGTDKKIQCFRLKGDGADLIGTNDKITVSGVIKNYNGTIEFDSGCTLDAYELSQVEVPIYETPAEIMDAAYALDEGATLSDGHAYTLTGVITEVNFAYDEGYGNASVTIAVDGTDKSIYCYKMAGTGADVVGVGDTVTVTGPIKNYKGKIEFDGCTLDSYVVKEEVPTFTGRDVTLGDDLDVGFYVDIPEAYDPANLSVVFEVNGNITTVAIQPDTEGNYVIHLEVPAKDMTTTIKAKVMDQSETVHSEISTTVAEYADQIIAGDVDATAAEVAAATAMVNYGAMAQIYFNHNTGNLANVGNETDLSAADVSGIADLAVTGDSSNFIGASLVLKSRLAVRLYFTEQVEGSKYNSNGWYIEVTDIDAANLATTQNVTVGETTYSFSALSFAKQVIEGSYNANFQNLMKALVLYEAAASVL